MDGIEKTHVKMPHFTLACPRTNIHEEL